MRHRLRVVRPFLSSSPLRPFLSPTRTMAATSKGYKSHEERTMVEPRENEMHTVLLSQIEQINDSIRLLQLRVKDARRGIKFMPGQWLDVFVPGIEKAGGFTITSIPRDGAPATESSVNTPFVELAVQRSPSNPPAAWLWQSRDIINAELNVRVGGSFVWPPPGIDQIQQKRLILIAGGVGINPLMSILSHIHAMTQRSPGYQSAPDHILLLYSTKAGEAQKQGSDILFFPRIQTIARHFAAGKLNVKLFLTGSGAQLSSPGKNINVQPHRIEQSDLAAALGTPEQRENTICYVCGPPQMTDAFVEYLKNAPHVREDRVLCEKWW